MMKRILKYGMIGTLTLVLTIGVAYQVMAAPGLDQYLFSVHVKAQHGETVDISFPPSLLNTVYTVMPRKIQRLCNEMDLTPEIILAELETLDGDDLVRIEGQDEVRIWLEPVDEENRRDLGFVHVRVDEGRDDGNVVNVRVPQGLARIAGNVLAKTGLVEEMIELPEEIEKMLESE